MFLDNLWQKIEYLSVGRPDFRGAEWQEEYEFRNLSPILQAFIAPMFLLSNTFIDSEKNWLDKLSMAAIFPFLMVLSDVSLLLLTIWDTIAIFFHYGTSITLESVRVLAFIVAGVPLEEIDYSQIWYPDIIRNNREIIMQFWWLKVMYRVFFFDVLFFVDVHLA